jgi:hypothetical protein
VSVPPDGERHAGQRTAQEAGQGVGGPQNIATAITDVTERVGVLVREEVELAKAELAEKASKLARGAVVAVVAGVFFVTALFFVLIGLAWLLYYYLPIGSEFTYFWGFFAMALILVVLGAIAGLLAAKAVKKGSPPVPTMAIEEARLIRETMSSGIEHGPGSHGPPGTASHGAAQPDGGAGPYGAVPSVGNPADDGPGTGAYRPPGTPNGGGS